MRASSRPSKAAKSVFCRSIRSASTRLRNWVIGGSSSRSDPAGVEQLVELAQCRLGVGALQIVVGAEEALAAGLALAAGDRTERVETPGDGGEETLLALHVSRNRTEDRRLLLVGAVRAAEPLDRRIGVPARLQQVMHPLALVPAAEIGVIAAPGAAGIGEDEDPLVVVHESRRLGEIRRGGTALDAEAVAAFALPPHGAPRA